MLKGIFAEIINDEDASVAKAVKACLPEIAQAIDAIVPRIRKGGRVVYMGAGTSGRYGIALCKQFKH